MKRPLSERVLLRLRIPWGRVRLQSGDSGRAGKDHGDEYGGGGAHEVGGGEV